MDASWLEDLDLGVSWGDGLCCAFMVCNCVLLACATVFFTRGGKEGESVDVNDDGLWADSLPHQQVMVTVEGGGPPPLSAPGSVQSKVVKEE